MWERYLWQAVVGGVMFAFAVRYADAVRAWLPSDCVLLALTAVVACSLYYLQTRFLGDE